MVIPTDINNYIIHFHELSERQDNIYRIRQECIYANIVMLETYESDRLSTDENFWHKCVSATTKAFVPYRPLKKGEISLIEKFISCLYDCLENDGIMGFFEDDCVFYESNTYYETLEKAEKIQYDVLVLGGGFDDTLCTYKAAVPGFRMANHPATNTTSSMVFNENFIKYVIPLMESYIMPLDWHLNYVFKMLDAKIWHCHPYICGQNKSFESSLQ